MPKKSSKKQSSRISIKQDVPLDISLDKDFDVRKKIKDLSEDELKDLLLITSYKLAMTRSQLDALADLLIKKKVITYEEFWKLTNERFKNVKP